MEEVKHYENLQHSIINPELEIGWADRDRRVLRCKATKHGGAVTVYVFGLARVFECTGMHFKRDLSPCKSEVIKVTVSDITDFINTCELDLGFDAVYRGSGESDLLTHSFSLEVNSGNVNKEFNIHICMPV